MLVRSFEIQVGRPALIFPVFQHESVGRSGIEPDIDDVADLFVVLRVIIIAEKTGRWARKPGVRPFLAECGDNAVDNGLVAQRLTGFFIDKYGDRDTPGALARYAPIRAVFNHRVEPVLPLFWIECGLVDGIEGLLAQLVRIHRDKPLCRIAKNQRRFRTPGMRVVMPQAGFCQQAVDGQQLADHGAVCVS